MSQVNPAAAALAAAMSALTPNQQQNSLLPPADIARLIAMNPSLATQLLAQPGTPLLASLHGVQQGTISSTQDRRSQYRRSRSRSRGRSSSSGGRRSHDSREYRRRRGDHHYRSAQGRGSERRGEDYSRSPKDSSYRYSRLGHDDDEYAGCVGDIFFSMLTIFASVNIVHLLVLFLSSLHFIWTNCHSMNCHVLQETTRRPKFRPQYDELFLSCITLKNDLYYRISEVDILCSKYLCCRLKHAFVCVGIG